MDDMAKRDALMNQLAEIADYFAGCADNAAKGSKAEVHFMVMKNAAKVAGEKLNRCTDCRFSEELIKPERAGYPDASRSNGTWYYICGACGTAINYKDKFCRGCGRAVKWDG